MDNKNCHIQHCILYAYHRGLSGADAAREICGTYGEGSTTESTCNRWFAKFRSGDTSLLDQARSGRPSTFDNDRLDSLLKANPRLTTRELADDIGVSHTTIEDHLHEMGKVLRLGVWVPHELSVDNKNHRTSSLLSRSSAHHYSPATKRSLFWIESSQGMRSGSYMSTSIENASG